MRVVLHPYKIGSRSCLALRDALRARGVRCSRTGRKYRQRVGDVFVNWGASTQAGLQFRLNPPDMSAAATDKLALLRKLAGVRTPEWTDDKQVALQWVQEGATVFARTLLRASSGRGIVVCTTPDELVDAPLYTKYVKKMSEFRVHVFSNEVIHVQEKRRRADAEEVDNQIRNHDNGWVFCVQNVEPPADVITQALAAVAASGLDFGAVDVIYNQHYDQAYVLEINTAPGLEGTTVEKYADAIVKFLT